MMDIRTQSSRDGHFGPPNTFYNPNQIYTNHFTVKNVQPPQYSQGIILNPNNVPSHTPPGQQLSCSRRSSISNNHLPPVLSQSTVAQHHYLAASGPMNRTHGHCNRMHGNPAAFSHAHPPQRLHNSHSSGQLSTSSFSRSRSVSSRQLNQQAQHMPQSIPNVQVAYVPVMQFPPPPPRFVQPQLHQSGVLYYPGHPMATHVPVQNERTARVSSPRARSFRQEEQEQKEKLLKASSSSSSGSATCLSILCEDTLLPQHNNGNVNNNFNGGDKEKNNVCCYMPIKVFSRGLVLY